MNIRVVGCGKVGARLAELLPKAQARYQGKK